MDMVQAVAKRTIELLNKTGKSQYRLIKETCLEKSTIQSIFKHKTKDIRLSTVFLIAQSFGMTLTEFFDVPYFKDEFIDV